VTLQNELARALGVDSELASSYLYLLANPSATSLSLSNGCGMPLSAAEKVLSEMEEKGMAIRASKVGSFTALHPRLAFSNVYRLSHPTPDREKRLRVDRITKKVIRLYKLV
jgi:sugar-specific transcriptional regulator TrmB